MHTTSIPGGCTGDRDGDGVADDYFYKWSVAGSDLSSTYVMNNIVYAPSHQKVSGFHIPTISDIENLCSMFNSMDSMLDMIEFDQTAFPNQYDYVNNYFRSARMFVNYPNTAHPEVGTSIYFRNTSNGPTLNISTSNNPDECCVVRLVRNMSNDEW